MRKIVSTRKIAGERGRERRREFMQQNYRKKMCCVCEREKEGQTVCEKDIIMVSIAAK